MRYKIVIGGITDGRHWEYYICKSLFLDEGEVKVRMYGEEIDSSQLSELAASELPDCEGIVVDCLPLAASQLKILVFCEVVFLSPID